MQPKPYIGITGFMSHSQVLSLFRAIPKHTDRLIMVGVLASSQTIRGIPNKWPNRYPRPTELGNIFIDHPLALNLIHYNTKEKETLFDQMQEVRSLAGPHCHGFQLNIAWPDPEVLMKVAMQSKRPIIVLQVGGHALEMVSHSPIVLADKVEQYKGLIDYVLLDPSGGLGTPLNPHIAQLYLQILSSKNLGMGLAVAGGLSASTLHLIEPLAKEFPDVSIDAEGKLRDKEDRLDIEAMRKYIAAALALFR